MRPIMKRQTSAYPGLFLAGLLALGLVAGCVADRGAALIRAAWEGDAREVDALLEQGADANARGREGRTALMASTWGSSGRGDVGIAQALVARGADVNARDRKGNTALDFARAESKRGARWKDVEAILEAAGAKE